MIFPLAYNTVNGNKLVYDAWFPPQSVMGIMYLILN